MLSQARLQFRTLLRMKLQELQFGFDLNFFAEGPTEGQQHTETGLQSLSQEMV